MQRIVDGIGRALAREFPSFEIYKKAVKQGLKTPCFFVKNKGIKCERFLGKRFLYTQTICVEVFLENPSDKEAFYSLYDTLISLLEVVETDDGYVRAKGMQSGEKDGRFYLSMDYAYYVMREETAENMQTLSQANEVK